MSTSLQIAKNYCANWQDGICAGIDFRLDGSLFRFRHEGCACLLKAKKACSYFETAVLPMETKECQNPSKRREFEEGAHQYRMQNRAPAAIRGIRKCPDCGTQLEFKKRYCANCQLKRRKQTNSVNQRNWRQNNRSA